MRKPTIDELLAQVGSVYELTMLAAKEATRIRLKDREAEEPLQQALERIADGKVKGRYLSAGEMDDYEKGERDRREMATTLRDKVIIQPPAKPVKEEK